MKGSVLARTRKMFPWLQIFMCGRVMAKAFKENDFIARRYQGFPTNIPLLRNGLDTCCTLKLEPSAPGDMKIMLHHSHFREVHARVE